MVLKTCVKSLMKLKNDSGLFSAAKREVKTGYDKAWIRDNLYIALGLEFVDVNTALRIIHRLLDVLLKHEEKINWAIKEKPKYAYQYIHARYNPETLSEFYEEWGNKQNDAVGFLLWKIGDYLKKNIKVLRDDNDNRIIQKLVYYLSSIEYYHDPDNGVWEEKEEIHSSSIGACVAGLKNIKDYFNVNEDLIKKGEDALNLLLPNESVTKHVDLAQLSLIYPFNVVSREQALKIIDNIEKNLLRSRGIIRYLNDMYYNKGGEAQWTMGLPWLAIIYKLLGNEKKYLLYLNKSLYALNEEGELPELYYASGVEHNDNTPLGWSEALLIAALNI